MRSVHPPQNIPNHRPTRRISSGEYLSNHAKLMLFDKEKIMVGSPNLDPRSKYINTEIGLLISSKALADLIMKQFKQDMAPQQLACSARHHRQAVLGESASGKRVGGEFVMVL